MGIEKLFFFMVIIVTITSMFVYDGALASIPSWTDQFGIPIGSTTPSGGGVEFGFGVAIANIVELNEPAENNDPLAQETISVQISSSADPTVTTLTLLEDGVDSSLFKSDNIVMAGSTNIFSVGDEAIVTIFDTVTVPGGPDPTTVQTIGSPVGGPPVVVVSETDPVGFDIGILTETGPDTNLYSATFTIGVATDSVNKIIGVNSGDVISVIDLFNNNKANGIVDPPVIGNKKLIIVNDDPGSFIRAEFEGMESDLPVLPEGGPGRGGGGLVRPGLVVDSPLVIAGGSNDSSGGGCSGDCIPPTLGMDKNLRRLVSHGFSYNNNPADVKLYYTPYPLITVNVGQENLAVFKIYDNGGTQNIAHLGFGFGLGEGESFNESKATINLDIARDGMETTTLYDPENALENVRITTAKEPCAANSKAQCLVVFIYHTFREPLNFNMVATYVWDHYKNAWQNYYNHGIEIVGESMNPPKTQLVAFGTNDMRGLYELIRIDKKEDIWKDEFDNLYQNLGNNRFDVIYRAPNDITYDNPTVHGCDRHCNWFESYKLNEEFLAQITLDEKIMKGKPIKGEPPSEPFSYEYHILKRSENPKLQQDIIHEQIRAEKLFDKLFLEHTHP